MTEAVQGFSLAQENLIPFYLIEDRIKQNFAKIEKNVKLQWEREQVMGREMRSISEASSKYKQEVGQKFLDLEKKIITQINSELEGRIIVAINKNMAAFTTRMQEKEKEIEAVSEGITQKLDAIKKSIIYEVSKENQKYFGKESEKSEKKMKATVQQMIKKAMGGKPNPASIRSTNRERELNESKGGMANKTYHLEPTNTPHSPQTYFSDEWVLRIKEMETKIAKFEEFSINADKRFYENMTSLKDSWKELGEQILETKRKLVVKQDDLKLQLIKMKATKEFEGSPEDYEETFKVKLMGKFTDIYQTISQLCSKSDLESSIEKVKKTVSRHEGELSDIREEMAKNSDYFTFYMNNSNEEDLSSRIKEISDKLADKETALNDRFKKQTDRNEILQAEITKATEQLQQIVGKSTKLERDYSQLREQLFKETERIDVLEDQNSFSPEKMAKIHNTLDIDFTPSQQELLAKKSHSNTQNVMIKELKGEISKLKDELFVLNHELADLDKIKKNMSGIESKLDKIKLQSEEAILSRKPWVCLSCDKEKQENDKAKREASKKKLGENRGGLFSKEKSDKLIKLIPSAEEKFEVYEKYKQKYLSDTVRLPDIYKQKIGDKEPM